MVAERVKRLLFLVTILLVAAAAGCTATATTTLPNATTPPTTITRTSTITIYTPYTPLPVAAGLTTVTVPKTVPDYITQTVTVNAPGGYPAGMRSINHAYSTTITSRLEMSSITFAPDMGWVFLVVRMNIQNLGYNAFPVSTNNYRITFGGQSYSPTSLPGLVDQMPAVPQQLTYGRTFEGLIVYRVPANISSPAQIQYTGPSGYSMGFNSIREYVPPTTTAPLK